MGEKYYAESKKAFFDGELRVPLDESALQKSIRQRENKRRATSCASEPPAHVPGYTCPDAEAIEDVNHPDHKAAWARQDAALKRRRDDDPDAFADDVKWRREFHAKRHARDFPHGHETSSDDEDDDDDDGHGDAPAGADDDDSQYEEDADVQELPLAPPMAEDPLDGVPVVDDDDVGAAIEDDAQEGAPAGVWFVPEVAANEALAQHLAFGSSTHPAAQVVHPPYDLPIHPLYVDPSPEVYNPFSATSGVPESPAYTISSSVDDTDDEAGNVALAVDADGAAAGPPGFSPRWGGGRPPSSNGNLPREDDAS